MAGKKDGSWIGSEASRRAKSAVAVAVSFIVLIGGLGFAGWKGYGYYMDLRQSTDYIGNGTTDVVVVVPDGSSGTKIAGILVKADVIKSVSPFTQLADSGKVQAGAYNLKTHIPAATALAWLLDPAHRATLKVMIPEGLRWTAIESQLVTAGTFTQAQLDDVTTRMTAGPADFGINTDWVPAGTLPEGYLAPNTYLLDYNAKPDDLVKAMVTQFNKQANASPLNLESSAEALGITVPQLVIVASIVEAEVNQDKYRPLVARVMYNRLAVGMPLQDDATVNYGLNRAGHANLDDAALKTDTPYNTYMHTGLPPTPINMPGVAALQAAAHPYDDTQAPTDADVASGKLLYFTTVNLSTGETKFEATDAQHSANVAQYQAWCRANPNVCK